MLLAVDIGNSSIKFGVFDGGRLLSKFSIPTKRDSTSDDLKMTFDMNRDVPISAAIVCSVVPEAENRLRSYIADKFGIEPVFVRNDFDFGLKKINYEPLSSLGTDRLVNAFAAVEKYGKPVIVCSFGTATTIDTVDSNSEYLGGIIAPGMNLMAEALHVKTSKLPKAEIKKPQSVIGNSTIGSIQSGIFYGYLGLVEGLIARFAQELGEKPKVVATGGLARVIGENCDAINVIDENLTLDGLRLCHHETGRTHRRK